MLKMQLNELLQFGHFDEKKYEGMAQMTHKGIQIQDNDLS